MICTILCTTDANLLNYHVNSKTLLKISHPTTPRVNFFVSHSVVINNTKNFSSNKDYIKNNVNRIFCRLIWLFENEGMTEITDVVPRFSKQIGNIFEELNTPQDFPNNISNISSDRRPKYEVSIFTTQQKKEI